MKEATGEANMTIVTVLLIGIITVIATPIIKNIVSSSERRACCVNNGGMFVEGKCCTNESCNTEITLTDAMCN